EATLLLQYGFGRCRPKEIHAILYSFSLEDADYSRAIRMLLLNLVLFRLIAVWLLIWRANPIENRRKRVSRIGRYREKLQPEIAVFTGMESTLQQFRIRQSRANRV